jgi:hypothetical protein
MARLVDQDVKDAFWRRVCAISPTFMPLVVIEILFLIGLIASFIAVEPGTDTYYVTIITFPIVIFTLGGFLYVLFRCRRKSIPDLSHP